MTVATMTGFEGVFWRPSALAAPPPRVAPGLRSQNRLAAIAMAAICAFALAFAAAPHATGTSFAGSETGVAAQTDLTATGVGFGGPETPAAVGPNGVYASDGMLGCCVAPRTTQGLRFADEAAEGFGSMSSFRRAHGSAGPDAQWHHVVEWNPTNLGQFGAESIHNTSNIVALDTTIHRQVSGYYSSSSPSRVVRPFGSG